MLSTTAIDIERVAASFERVDAMEVELQRLEDLVAQVRARQIAILAAVRAHGGEHDPARLVLLCWFHHHVVVHQYRFTIDPDTPPGRRRFLAPAVTRAPPHE